MPDADPMPADDAVLAAPDNHQVLFENDDVRVLMTSIPPGASTPVHSHRWPAGLYILSWSDFLRHDPDGAITFDSRTMPEIPQPGAASWTPAVPSHFVENIGDADLRIVACEVKRAGG